MLPSKFLNMSVKDLEDYLHINFPIPKKLKLKIKKRIEKLKKDNKEFAKKLINSKLWKLAEVQTKRQGKYTSFEEALPTIIENLPIIRDKLIIFNRGENE